MIILSEYRIFYPPSAKTVFVIVIVVMERKAYPSAGAKHFISKGGHKSAYRMVPVHPDDRLLLCMQWENNLYVDGALLFDLRSTSKIYLQWSQML